MTGINCQQAVVDCEECIKLGEASILQANKKEEKIGLGIESSNLSLLQ